MNKRKAPVYEEEEEEEAKKEAAEVISDRCVIDQCGRGCRHTCKHVVNTEYHDSAVSTVSDVKQA